MTALDIETIPAPPETLMILRMAQAERFRIEIEADAQLPPGQRSMVANNLINRDAIQRDVERRIEKATRQTTDRDSLDPDLCRPICIVTCPMSRLHVPFELAQKVKGHEQLAVWHDGVKGHAISNIIAPNSPLNGERICGFNVLDFDIPVLRNWAVRIGFSIPEFLERPAYDVFQTLTQHRKFNWPNHKSLKTYAAIYLANPELYASEQDYQIFEEYIKSDFSGADVAPAYLEGRWHDIIRHCTLDCLIGGMLCRLFFPSGLRREL